VETPINEANWAEHLDEFDPTAQLTETVCSVLDWGARDDLFKMRARLRENPATSYRGHGLTPIEEDA
jgi:hypothetical protein